MIYILLLGQGGAFYLRLSYSNYAKLLAASYFSAFAIVGDDIDSFKALCTALAATVGTSNIVSEFNFTANKTVRNFILDVDDFLWNGTTKYAEGCLAVRYDDQTLTSNFRWTYNITMKRTGENWKPTKILCRNSGCALPLVWEVVRIHKPNTIMSSLEVSFGIAHL